MSKISHLVRCDDPDYEFFDSWSGGQGPAVGDLWEHWPGEVYRVREVRWKYMPGDGSMALRICFVDFVNKAEKAHADS